jgi:hypothetical protein
MKCWRVWFDDGSAALENARTAQEAMKQAERRHPGTHAIKAECLD